MTINNKDWLVYTSTIYVFRMPLIYLHTRLPEPSHSQLYAASTALVVIFIRAHPYISTCVSRYSRLICATAYPGWVIIHIIQLFEMYMFSIYTTQPKLSLNWIMTLTKHIIMSVYKFSQVPMYQLKPIKSMVPFIINTLLELFLMQVNKFRMQNADMKQ